MEDSITRPNRQCQHLFSRTNLTRVIHKNSRDSTPVPRSAANYAEILLGLLPYSRLGGTPTNRNLQRGARDRFTGTPGAQGYVARDLPKSLPGNERETALAVTQGLGLAPQTPHTLNPIPHIRSGQTRAIFALVAALPHLYNRKRRTIRGGGM